MKARILSLITLLLLGVGIVSFAQDSRNDRDRQRPQRSQSEQRPQRSQSEQRSQTEQRSQRSQTEQRSGTEQRMQTDKTEQGNRRFQGSQSRGRNPQNVPDNQRNDFGNQRDYQRGQIQRMPSRDRDRMRRDERIFHYRNGGYYDHNNRYIGTLPPLGYRFRHLPLGYRIIRDAGMLYYYFRGIFYMMNDYYNEYEVVDPPIGAIVYDLPYEAERVLVNGRIYYQYNGVLFRPINTPNGRAYRVEGKLANDQYEYYPY